MMDIISYENAVRDFADYRAVDDYLLKIGEGKFPKVLGRVNIKNENFIGITLLFLLNDADMTYIPCENAIFSDWNYEERNMLRMTNSTKSNVAQEKVELVDVGSYVTIYLCGNGHRPTFTYDNKLLSFKWETFEAVHSLDEIKDNYVNDLIKVYCDNGSRGYSFSVTNGNILENKIDDKIKGKCKELSEIESKIESSKKQQREFKDLSTDIENLKIEIEKLGAEKQVVIDETNKKKKEVEKLENNKTELNTNKEKILSDIEKLSPQKEMLNQEIAKLEAYKEKLAAYGIVLDRKTKKEEGTTNSKAYEGKFSSIVDYIGTNISNQTGNFHYSKEEIANMILGLYSNQMVLLVGNPGSGKTSLIQKFSKAIGKEAGMIAVQSNWMDKTDLLGYYNPIDKKFIPTTFTEMLIEYVKLAKDNPDKFYMICLDEMNLSHIEYYFADFLSALQTEERKINLYSESLYEDALKEIDTKLSKFAELKNPSDEEIEKAKEYETEREKLCKYKPVVNIPENLVFFGTLNQDDTTKDLSPKVIDRSYFIRIEADNGTPFTSVELDVNCQYYLKKCVNLDKKSAILVSDIKNLANKNVVLNYRLDKLVKNVLINLPNENQNDDKTEWLDDNKLKDFIIAATVLPRLKSKMNGLEKYPLSNNIYTTYMKADDDISYWRSAL